MSDSPTNTTSAICGCTTSELAYLEAKWAAQVSFATVRALLQEVLPIEQGLHQETIRQHVQATAERLEAELGPEQFAYDGGSQREIEASPEPSAPITVGLGGGYIRGRDRLPGANGCFEVIAGKSIPQEGAAKVFAFVHRIDRKPKRRLRAVLESQGILPRQHITFLRDGGDTVRELGAFVHPRSEHILDWFHVAMRIEQLLQTARGVQGAEKGEFLKNIERVKWFLWHENVFRADETLYDLLEEIADIREEQREDGERYRCGERISTGFVESAVNQVISKRFVKKQQMRWTPRGAHLLLQVRTQVLNDELRASFERWYPRLGAQDQASLTA